MGRKLAVRGALLCRWREAPTFRGVTRTLVGCLEGRPLYTRRAGGLGCERAHAERACVWGLCRGKLKAQGTRQGRHRTQRVGPDRRAGAHTTGRQAFKP
nr:MAG TPA: hypothetical protein [Caudoviricetes sp.]